MTEFEQSLIQLYLSIDRRLASIEERLPAKQAASVPPRDPASVRVGEVVECRLLGDGRNVAMAVENVWQQRDDGSQPICTVNAFASAAGFTYDADLSQPGTWRFLPAVGEKAM